MAKFVLLAASLTVLGLGAMVYHSVVEEETISPRVDRSVPASSSSDASGVMKHRQAVSVSTPIGPPSGGSKVSDAGGHVVVGRSHEMVVGAPVSSLSPPVLRSTPIQRNVAIEPMALGPSPGAQVSKEVFAEDVIARRAAYGKSARTLPEAEEFGN